MLVEHGVLAVLPCLCTAPLSVRRHHDVDLLSIAAYPTARRVERVAAPALLPMALAGAEARARAAEAELLAMQLCPIYKNLVRRARLAARGPTREVSRRRFAMRTTGGFAAPDLRTLLQPRHYQCHYE